ncbi:MAG: hypothetical protein GX592_03380 [Clostridiales bacterium]|nr:hypothetical protein [Clostridiales bacterium]
MKHCRKYLAIALALMLLSAPFALAEQLDVYSLTIKNPVVYVDGMPMADLTGLGIEGSTASVDGRQVVRLRLLGNGEPVADAYAAFDGRWLLAGAEGISNIYGLPLEKIPGFSDLAVNSALLEALFSGETLEQVVGVLLGAMEGFSATVEQSMVEEGVQRIDHAAGQIEMQGYTVVLKSEDLQALIDEIGEGLTAIPAVEQLMLAAGGAAGYDVEKDGEFDIASVLGEGMTFTVWVAEDGETMRVEGRYSITNPEEKGDKVDYYILEDFYHDEFGREIMVADGLATMGGEEFVKLTGNVMTEEFGDGVAMEMDFSGTANFEGTWQDVLSMKGTLYPKGYTADNPDRTVFDFSMDMLDEVEPGSFRLNGYYAPADGAEYLYDELSVSLYGGAPSDNFTFEFLTQTQHEGGQEYYGAQLTVGENDQLVSVYYTFEGDYSDNAFGDEDHQGSLKAGFSDGTMAAEFAADIATARTSADAAAMPAFDGTPVNVMMLGEKDMDLLEMEGGLLMQKIMVSLSEAVPGLQALMSMGFL